MLKIISRLTSKLQSYYILSFKRFFCTTKTIEKKISMQQLIEDTNKFHSNMWCESKKISCREAVDFIDNNNGYYVLEEGYYSVNLTVDNCQFNILIKENLTNGITYKVINEDYSKSNKFTIVEDSIDNNIEPVNNEKNIDNNEIIEDFDEGILFTQVMRSMMDNNSWVFLHNDLTETITWLTENDWIFLDKNKVFLNSKPTEDGDYEAIYLSLDSNNFPTLKARIFSYKEFPSTKEYAELCGFDKYD